MKSSSNYIINVLAVGFLALLFLSVPLFWACKLCQGMLYAVEWGSPRAGVRPSGFLPEIDSEPNTVSHSTVATYLRDEIVFASLGLLQNEPLSSELYKTASYYAIRDPNNKIRTWHLVYFDKDLGLVVHCDIAKTGRAGKRRWRKSGYLYAGPEGVADTAEKTLGRFAGPLIFQRGSVARFGPASVLIFDGKARRFFKIRFDRASVTKGPEIPKDYHPVQISLLDKNREFCGGIRWEQPYRRATPQEQEEWEKEQGRMETYYDYEPSYGSTRYRPIHSRGPHNVNIGPDVKAYGQLEDILVLDKSCRIKRLDAETLEFVGSAGSLPVPPPRLHPVTTDNLLAYTVVPFFADGRELGIACSSVSSDASALALSVFDPNGKPLGWGDYTRDPFVSPGGPGLIVAKFLLENLYPPVLALASYFTRSSFEPSAGHRALFILPNALAPTAAGNNYADDIGMRIWIELMMISPSIILSLLLTWHLRVNATTVGLSQRAKFYWTIGTIAFGLPAYITYRLTRPKIKLVTCASCGKARRPDMEKCHRCGGKWHAPELTPPAWRVIAE